MKKLLLFFMSSLGSFISLEAARPLPSSAVSRIVPGGSVGLTNSGNDCFLNATLQALFFTPSVKSKLLSLDDVALDGILGSASKRMMQKGWEKIRVTDDNRSSLVSKLIKRLFSDMVRSAVSLPSQGARARLCHWIPLLKALQHGQQDPQELFVGLIENMLPVVKQIFLFTEQQTTEHVFYGPFKPHPKSVYSPGPQTHLQLQVYSSLEESLQEYTAPVELKGDAQYICEFCCNNKFDAIQQKSFLNNPQVLMMQIKRFSHEAAFDIDDTTNTVKTIFKPIKNNTPMTIPQVLDFNGEKYRLCSLVMHLGSRATSGHYMAAVCAQNNTWYLYDDDRITDLSQNIGALLQGTNIKYKRIAGDTVDRLSYEEYGTPYLVFYERVAVVPAAAAAALSAPSPLSVIDVDSPVVAPGPPVPSAVTGRLRRVKAVASDLSDLTSPLGETGLVLAADDMLAQKLAELSQGLQRVSGRIQELKQGLGALKEQLEAERKRPRE